MKFLFCLFLLSTTFSLFSQEANNKSVEYIYRIKGAFDISSREALIKAANFEIIADVNRGEFIARSFSRLDNLQQYKGISLEEVNSAVKIAPSIPSYLNEKVRINIFFYEKTNQEIIDDFLSHQKNIISNAQANSYDQYRYSAEVAGNRIIEIANSPLVKYIDLIEDNFDNLILEARSFSAANIMNSSLLGERNLNGNGVVVGVGDGGSLGPHIDVKGKIIDKANGNFSSFGDHPDIVSGIIVSGGVVEEKYRGIAPLSTVITDYTSNIIYNAPSYLTAHNMTISNNSYGLNHDCANNGTYNSNSKDIDAQIYTNSTLMHVFAAGNSGSNQCPEYPFGYRTLLRYYQASKNGITVGLIDYDGNVGITSSRGPASDGRIKPDICANGSPITSANRVNEYSTSGGTSVASPVVVGVLALMTERYKQLNNNTQPPSALLKAALLNSATDKGNQGPDYIYGFGAINSEKAIKTLEENRYKNGSVNNNVTKNYSITIPANVEQVKVMLYWHDKAADPYPAKTLINNLDLKVVTPGGTTYLPWVLNFSPANVADLPTRQVDTLNNVEQITIDNPTSGTYTVKVSGSYVPYGPQEFYVTYDFIYKDIELIYPYGGEKLVTNDNEMITWEVGANAEAQTVKLEYSLNDGASWNLIADDVPAINRLYYWAVPLEIYSTKAKVKITNNTNNTTDISQKFVISQKPIFTSFAPDCNGNIQLTWNTIAGANKYEVYRYNETSRQYESLGITTNTNFTVAYAVADISYWYSIAAILEDGSRTLRSKAIYSTSKTCIQNVVVNNLTFQPKGRELTSSSLAVPSTLEVSLSNNNASEYSDFNIEVYIDGNLFCIDSTFNAFPNNSEQTFSIDTPIAFNSVGVHSIKVVLVGGVVGDNKTITVEELDNNPVNLPFNINFNSATVQSYYGQVIGFDQADLFDNNDTTVVSSISSEILFDAQTNTNINNNYIHISQLTFANSNTSTSSSNPYAGVVATFNLSGSTTNSIITNIKLKADIDGFVPNIYVRGSDSDTWISVPVAPLTTNWQLTDYINLTQLIISSGQTQSSSTQLLFATSTESGYSIDDIGLAAGSVLPVEISYFTATAFNGDALLKWQTLSEQNCNRFEIELAEPLENNETVPHFNSIGSTPCSSRSTSARSYEFWDISHHKAGTHYYRLKQIDENGDFTYSEVRSVTFEDKNSSINNVYPNPFVDEINIVINSKSNEQVLISLSDIDGRTLYSKTIDLVKDFNLVTINDFPTLSDGLYAIRIIYQKKADTILINKINSN
ncbi:MAG: S8 family peptidase [Saprospiraceae bacterium]|nr:S8 family peptidase [Saprospiraceae bacterium]